MPRQILFALAFFALAAPITSAQRPQLQRQQISPSEKPKVQTAVTVIDLRQVTAEKKPPKRAADPVYSTRRMSGAGSKSAVAALPLSQLGEALRGVGIGAPPANVYARFTPGQLTVPGKGYMILAAPYWTYPDHAEFYSTAEGGAPMIWNGPAVVLREPGTYVFDFVVEFPTSPSGTFHDCGVQVGFTTYQIQAVESINGPQHILVIWPIGQDMLDLGDELRSVGIHCSKPRAGDQVLTWKFFLVDVTKL